MFIEDVGPKVLFKKDLLYSEDQSPGFSIRDRLPPDSLRGFSVTNHALKKPRFFILHPTITSGDNLHSGNSVIVLFNCSTKLYFNMHQYLPYLLIFKEFTGSQLTETVLSSDPGGSWHLKMRRRTK